MPRVAVRRRSAAERSCSIPSVKLCKHGECGAIAVSYDGYCACCTSRKRLKNYNSRPAATRMKDPIGMELEVVHPLGVDKITPIARYVCNDASIGHNGGEIKFVAPASKIADKAADIAQRAAHAGCKANRHCGFHVHNSLPQGIGIGLRCTSPELRVDGYNSSNAMLRLHNFAKSFEEYFFDIVPRSRKSNNYCYRLGDYADAMQSHYAWFSLSSRVPTVELRIHGSTVNPWKVKGWMEVNVRMRELIHEVLLDHYSVNPLSIRQRSLKFSDYMPEGSLGKKYLIARENAGGSLKSFGF